MGNLLKPEEVAARIEGGKALLLAGDEKVLSGLPRGRWIGGTIPYFMSGDGGTESRDRIFVDELPEAVTACTITTYDRTSVPHLVQDQFANGFSVLLIPGFSDLHADFARNVSLYRSIFNRPLVGWIAGVAVEDIGRVAPKVINGVTGQWSTSDAVALHAALPPNLSASVEIINLFRPGDGATITFPEAGFAARSCRVDGVETNIARYIAETGIDVRLPLVADYYGAMINVSVEAMDAADGLVRFYAPVFPGIDYKFAAPVADYVRQFAEEADHDATGTIFSCNCILNYLYAGLKGRRTGNLTGPMTFGEIAYILLNQTVVILKLERAG